VVVDRYARCAARSTGPVGMSAGCSRQGSMFRHCVWKGVMDRVINEDWGKGASFEAMGKGGRAESKLVPRVQRLEYAYTTLAMSKGNVLGINIVY